MCEAYVATVAANLVSKLGEYLFAPIGRQFGYVLCYKSYIKDLKKEVEELKNARDRVQSSVDTARYDGKRIYNNVHGWLENVSKEAEYAENLLKDGENAKIVCFYGLLPNPVVRHPIGRKMKNMTRVIQALHKKRNFQAVQCEDPPPGIVTAANAAKYADTNEDVLESRASFAEEVIKAIADDKVSVVGVYGPGGVGKSMLLADIERRAKKEMLFHEVAVATVSRNPDPRRIQGEIAHALGLDITNEETIYGRANRLYKRLESASQGNILIILDNLWTKLELKEVGIPCGHNNKVRGCKLLLTSRNREVLVDMSSDKKLRLNELEDGEAQRLFERTMGHAVDDLEIKHLVERVVKNCGGLPILIVAWATRLKDGDVAQWRKASTNTEDMKSIVINNHNELKEERIRSLFLGCALDTGRSFMRDALVYCMGLELYEKSTTLENARDTLIFDVRSLQGSCLLKESDDVQVFKMHDIIVDVAISISSTDWYALVGKKECGFNKWSTDDLRKCTAISFNFVGIDEIPENLDCPNLRILLLCEHNPSLKISNSFFESMDKLQVLDITGLSFTSLPSSIEFLKNLNSLCLDCCHLEDVTVLGKLKGLQFLSFHGSTIAQLSKDLGGLTKLRFLDLKRCTKLKVIEPDVLGSLVNLEELHMEEGYDQWEAEDEAPRSNAALAELRNMKNLTTLSIAIPHSTTLPSYLPFGKLKNYHIQIGDGWDSLVEHKESRTLKLKLDSSNLLLEEWVQKCLQRTQNLHLDGLKDGDNSIHNLCIEEFQELKHLHVQDCSSFQYVVQSTENVQCTAFTRLESLFLKNLNNLENICCGHLTLQSFGKLKIVKLDNCGEIKHLFPLSMTRILSQLKEIEINRCYLMQQIVTNVEDRDEIGEVYVYPEVKSYDLHRLTLRNLPEMTSFCKITDHSVGFFGGKQVRNFSFWILCMDAICESNST